MPATVVVVLDDPDFAGKVVRSLMEAGHDAIAFPDSMIALNSLEDAHHIELLVTSLDHAPSKPNGVSLALMARTRLPGLRAIFVGPSSAAHWVGGLGALMAPVDVEEMVATIAAMLEAEDSQPSSPLISL